MKKLGMLLGIIFCCLSAWGGWNNWTPQQKAEVKTWINQQQIHDTVKLRNLITTRPIIGYNDWNEQVVKDLIWVKAEKMTKQIAIAANIVKTDTPAQMDAKLQTWMGNDSARIYQASKFWTAYFYVRTIEGLGADTETIYHHDPIYGKSVADELNLGNITCDDIEGVLREK